MLSLVITVKFHVLGKVKNSLQEKLLDYLIEDSITEILTFLN